MFKAKPLDIIEEEEDQSLDETDLIDQEGQFIIFAPPPDNLKTEQNNQILEEVPASDKKEKTLDKNFEKLNYVNKI